MKDYTVIVEETMTGYSAYVPDLPGCVTVGITREETIAYMKEAIALYLEELVEAGRAIPAPKSSASVVSV